MPRFGGPLVLLLATVLLAGCGASRFAAPRATGGAECVPFARALTGIELSGDAAEWWDAAEGRYTRTPTPEIGSLLVFRRSARLPHGHVAVVSGVLSGRQVLLTHANWAPGRISADQPAIDLSPGNDWTEVRVWWEPSGAMGLTAYPTYGFITPDRPMAHDALVAEAAALAMDDARRQ